MANLQLSYTLFEKWCLITTEGARHIFFSVGPLEECLKAEEVEEMA